MFELESITINSHKGVYKVHFLESIFEKLAEFNSPEIHIIIDKKVKNIYQNQFVKIQQKLESALVIEASEIAKSIEKFPDYIENLIINKVRRGNIIVAIGGGVIQDIACFISSTFLRG
ncbi:MAG: 3-dehydroquinate synthase, partial [Bdellovibrionota bacterium]